MRKGLRNGLMVGAGVLVAGVVAAGIPFFSAIRANPPAGQLGSFSGLTVADPNGSPRFFGTVAPVGKPTIVTFWASWCVPCLAETKALVAERSRYPASDLAIVAINVDAKARDTARLATFLDRSGGRALTQVLATDPTYATITGHRMLALPRSFIFDRTGASMLTLAGYKPGESDAELDNALKGAIGR